MDAVVLSDPGFEWAHTYALLPRVRRMCALHGLRLILLQKPDPAVAEAHLRQLPPPGDPARVEAIAARPCRADEATTSVEERVTYAPNFNLPAWTQPTVTREAHD